MSTFIIAGPITKLGFGTASVLFPKLITFYKVYCVFGIGITLFVNAINFARISYQKSWDCFSSAYPTQKEAFSHRMEQDWLATSIYGKTDLTRQSFKLLPFLKPILGIFVKPFLCCSCDANKICSTYKMYLFSKTGQYVISKVTPSPFLEIFSLSKRVSIGWLQAFRISLRINFSI